MVDIYTAFQSDFPPYGKTQRNRQASHSKEAREIKLQANRTLNEGVLFE